MIIGIDVLCGVDRDERFKGRRQQVLGLLRRDVIQPDYYLMAFKRHAAADHPFGPARAGIAVACKQLAAAVGHQIIVRHPLDCIGCSSQDNL